MNFHRRQAARSHWTHSKWAPRYVRKEKNIYILRRTQQIHLNWVNGSEYGQAGPRSGQPKRSASERDLRSPFQLASPATVAQTFKRPIQPCRVNEWMAVMFTRLFVCLWTGGLTADDNTMDQSQLRQWIGQMLPAEAAQFLAQHLQHREKTNKWPTFLDKVDRMVRKKNS